MDAPPKIFGLMGPYGLLRVRSTKLPVGCSVSSSFSIMSIVTKPMSLTFLGNPNIPKCFVLPTTEDNFTLTPGLTHHQYSHQLGILMYMIYEVYKVKTYIYIYILLYITMLYIYMYIL